VRTYYTPEHMETILKRAVAKRMSPGKIMFLLIWFWGCVTQQRVHPLQGGFLRRKVRADRRPGFPVDNPVAFHARRAGEMISTWSRVAGMLWRLSRVRARPRRDPAARSYMDQALLPVADSDLETLEMLNVTHAARAAGDKVRRGAGRGARPRRLKWGGLNGSA
jgi:hypothetical protein